MSLIVNGLEKSDDGALDEEQRKKLKQLKVDIQKVDEKYIRAHPELEVICHEFIRDILHRRPEDVFAYASAWFSSDKLRMHIKNHTENKPADRDFDFTHDSNQMNL